MIAKEIKKKAADQSSFRRLANYITRYGTENFIVPSITNCLDNDYERAIKVVENLQDLVNGKTDKTYHVVLSFHAQDILTEDKLAYIEEACCKALGFEGHQRISALHRDTEHPHLHIAINRVNPVTKRQITPFYSHQKLAKFCESMEIELGLIGDNHIPKNQSQQIPQNHLPQEVSKEREALWDSYQEMKQKSMLNRKESRESINLEAKQHYQALSDKYKKLREEIKRSTLLSPKQKFRLYQELAQSRKRNYQKASAHFMGKRRTITLDNPIPSWKDYLTHHRQAEKEKAKQLQSALKQLRQDNIKAWIDERNQYIGQSALAKRYQFFGKQQGQFTYEGVRNIGENQHIALLEKDGVIWVKPISAAQQSFLRSIRRGNLLEVSPDGQFKALTVQQRRGRS